MKIIITGGTGMVGMGFKNLKTSHDFILVGSRDYDLRSSNEADRMMKDHRPDAVIHLAARVGGVKGNSDYMCDFFYDNIMINTNVLQSAFTNNVKKVVSLLSTCIYPDDVSYPLTENQIHNGEPHKSNFGYAYAKRMVDIHSRALRQQHGCSFICAVPNNLYGPYDNFDLENSHVIPAIMRKVWESKLGLSKAPVFWGTGSPLREFTYSFDIPEILIYLLENYDQKYPINIGKTGEISIKDVTRLVCENLEYHGPVEWDISKPEGQHRKPSTNKKLLDCGFNNDFYTSFEDGLRYTCKWFMDNYPNVRGVM